MSWFALHRSDELFALLEEDPKGFCLLTLIAARARFQEDPCPVTGLRYGQAFVGDFRKAGIASRQAYRLSIRRLTARGFVTIQGTNKGTIATLLPQAIYTISTPTKEPTKEPTKNHQGTNQEPLTNKGTREQGNNDDPSLFVFEEPSEPKKKARFNPMTTRIKNKTPEMDMIGACFGAPEEIVWTTLESQLLKRLEPTHSEIKLIREFYAYEIEDNNGYRNRSVKGLLQNWSAQLIAARDFFNKNPHLPRS
jgi:hypothetical protein